MPAPRFQHKQSLHEDDVHNINGRDATRRRRHDLAVTRRHGLLRRRRRRGPGQCARGQGRVRRQVTSGAQRGDRQQLQRRRRVPHSVDRAQVRSLHDRGQGKIRKTSELDRSLDQDGVIKDVFSGTAGEGRGRVLQVEFRIWEPRRDFGLPARVTYVKMVHAISLANLANCTALFRHANLRCHAPVQKPVPPHVHWASSIREFAKPATEWVSQRRSLRMGSLLWERGDKR